MLKDHSWRPHERSHTTLTNRNVHLPTGANTSGLAALARSGQLVGCVSFGVEQIGQQANEAVRHLVVVHHIACYENGGLAHGLGVSVLPLPARRRQPDVGRRSPRGGNLWGQVASAPRRSSATESSLAAQGRGFPASTLGYGSI